MKSRSVLLSIAILVAITNLNMQCHKGYDDMPLEYEFREGIAITPYQQDYNVGDTIWLEVNIPGKKLFDQKTGSRVFYDSARFTSMAQVELLYNNPFIATGTFASFIFPSGISAFINNGYAQTYASINYGCSPSPDYHLRLGIVLLQKGVFGISFYNTSITKCITEHYRNSKLTYAFSVNDTHKTFYQQLPFAAIGTKPDENVLYRLDQKTMVVINVR